MPMRVEKHARSKMQEEHITEYPSRVEKYNDSAWLRLRIMKLRRNPMCEHCKITPAKHVHHKIKVRDDKSHYLNMDNLESLCHSCHSKHHAKNR